MRRATLTAAALLLAISCGLPKKGLLKLHDGPPDALLTIDDRYVGQLGQLPRGIKLTAGKHMITIEKTGHFAVDYEVDIKAERTTELPITLTPVPE